MKSLQKALLGIGGLLALWIGWGSYVSRSTERVPYETLDQYDGMELRQYPETVLVETTASDSVTAFRRLYRYITGANEAREEVAMTVPVATRGESITMPTPLQTVRRGGTTVPMTAPVRSEEGEDQVTMAFYLPASYTPETAPEPTDPDVELAVEPPRTVAVRQFSWYATDERVARERQQLLDQLSGEEIETTDEPVLLQYNDPWTPPFMRTNEIEVEVELPREEIPVEEV